MSACILVATDGKPGALGALRAARAQAERDGSRVEVISVYEPADVFAIGPMVEAVRLPTGYSTSAVESLRGAVLDQLGEVGGSATEWPLAVEVGRVAPSIAAYAKGCGATTVMLGLRQRATVGRWLGRETLLRVIHLAHVPVLGIPASGGDPPRQAIVAIDFSEFGERLGGEVLERVATGARVHLVHVLWAPPVGAEWIGMEEWGRTYRSGVEERLEEVAGRMERTAAVGTRIHVLSGSPVEEILRLAEEIDADLVAVGSHGTGFIGRMLLGSVSSGVVHGASCAVLVSPPPEAASETRGLREERERRVIS